MASQLLQNISQSAEERARFRSRRMFETDLTSNILTAEERGEIRGEARGRKEGIEFGMEKGRGEGRGEALEEVIELIEQGYSADEIKVALAKKRAAMATARDSTGG